MTKPLTPDQVPQYKPKPPVANKRKVNNAIATINRHLKSPKNANQYKRYTVYIEYDLLGQLEVKAVLFDFATAGWDIQHKRQTTQYLRYQ